MLKYVIGILAITLLMKRSSTPNSVTTAVSAPPEGNISSWANHGASAISTVDQKSFYDNNGGTNTFSSTRRAVPPIRVAPSVSNFQTRGFYNNTGRYSIPGRN